MTDKEKLIKIKSLADKMSDTAFNMTTDASLLRKAMDEYHQFIINEYHKEEQVIKELQEEPASEKKCMFTKDNYTDEDRKVFCKDCKEKCEYSKKEEHVSESIDFEQELYKAFGQIKDFTLGIAIAKRFYDMGRKHNEPVSEELGKAAVEAFKQIVDDERNSFLEIFKAGAEWKISKLMAKAIDGIARPDDNEIWCNLSTFNFKDGDKCKVILIKED